MKHKHYDMIVAWADGAEIQWRSKQYTSNQWYPCVKPSWDGDCEYRIKPEPKIDAYVFIKLNTMYGNVSRGLGVCDSNIKATIDGETGKLKSAEVI